MHNGSQPAAETNFVSLVSGIASDAKRLLLQEMALTKLEVKYELRKAKTAAITLGIGIGAVAAGGILLMLMLVHLLDALTLVPLWGCYGIVGIALVALGGGVLATGKSKIEELEVAPQQTVQRMKESAQWLTKQTTASDKT